MLGTGNTEVNKTDSGSLYLIDRRNIKHINTYINRIISDNNRLFDENKNRVKERG